MTPSQKIDTPLFHSVGSIADSMNRQCYVVGGYVRDLFLCRHSKDIDFVTVGSGIEVAEAVARHLGRGARCNVFKNFGTAQVKFRDTELEFVGARRESYSHDSRKPVVEDGTLDDDLSRRDFTITFSDDPLRMMRAIRFATQLGFTIYDETFEAISRNASRIKIISHERIADELMKIMSSPVPSIGWTLLMNCGLLSYILPELEAMKGVETVNGRGHKDNFYHTLTVLDNVARKSDNVWLRWGALLHDIAKPVTKRWDGKSGWTFHNHNFIGAKMVPRIFRNLRLPLNEKMKYVQKLVELHMRPIALVEDEVTDSAVRRLLFDAGDDIDELMTLCEADITSKNQVKVRQFLDNFALVRRKMVELEEKDRIRNFQPPVSGEEIMEIYGLSPSREVGQIKESIKNAILDGVIPNERDAALEYMHQVAAKMNLHPLNP